MNEKELFEAIGSINDVLIEESEEKPKSRPMWFKWAGLSAACLCILIAGYGVIHNIHLNNYVADVQPEEITSTTTSPSVNAPSILPSKPLQLLAAPVYPEMMKYPVETDYILPNGRFSDEYDIQYQKHSDIIRNQIVNNKGYSEGFSEFCKKTMPVFLNTENDKNIIYSPMNLYISLGMLAEITDGSSRNQILSTLGVDNTLNLQQKTKSIWNANYCDNGFYTSVLANSLWLRNDTLYNETTMKTLADNYYASSYSGIMGSEEMSKALQSWLNDNTGGFLSEQAGDITMNDDNMITLASTVYFNAQWANKHKFDETKTEPKTFTTLNGEEITCDFMYQNDYGEYLFEGENYTAVYLMFNSHTYYAGMWFILPNEGVPTDEVILTEDFLFMVNHASTDITHAEYFAEKNNFTAEYYNPLGIKADKKDLNMYVPKFDISYSDDFINKLPELGITDVLDPAISDYSPLTVDVETDVMLSEAKQTVRVKIDEEGCTAASFVVMSNPGTGGMVDIPEPYVFKLDRPFIFCITGTENAPMFMGVVNNPNA